MSQGFQGSFAAGSIRLPLSKFSYATVHGESIIPIPWIHLGRTNNLFAIFTTQRIDDGSGQLRDLKKFRVLQDPQVLEDIDLDSLAREAIRAKAEAQTSITNGRVPSVTVIVKIPCIAIRYPLEGGQIRRIQIRLANNDDYFETLKILSRANVPFGEAGSFPTQQQQNRPFSSSSSLLRPSDSASQIGARPVSVSSNLEGYSSVRAGDSAGWASASSLRPTISSGALTASPYGEFGTHLGQSSGLEDTPLNAPPSSFGSGYFSGSHGSHSIPPSRSTLDLVSSYAPINLYQPRPSTAPVVENQSINQMLPPKRQLPFSTSTPAKKPRKRPAKTETCSTDGALNEMHPSLSLLDLKHLKTSMSKAGSNIEGTSEVSENPAVTVPATNKKRVVTSRTTKTQATKKQPTKAPSIRTSRVAKEEDIVPGVEQLLGETQEPLGQQQEVSATIDTQDLLSRAEATKPYQSIELSVMYEKQGSQSEVTVPSSQTRKCLVCKSRKGKCNGGNPCDWCVDNPDQCVYDAPGETPSQPLQIQVPSSQPEETAEVQTKPSLKASLPVPTTSPTVSTTPETVAQPSVQEKQITQDTPSQGPSVLPKTPETRPVGPDATLINAAPTTLIADAAALHLSPNPNPLALLFREAAFADTRQLETWSTLPEPVQRSTLDTWMCQQLGDPAFIKLVKRIDESWQATLFGRSVGVDL